MLKTLVLRRKIDVAKNKLSELRAKLPDFDKREKELTEAFDEITEETPAEEKESIETQINEFDQEKGDLEKEMKNLQSEIDSAEQELEAAEAEQEKRSGFSGEKRNTGSEREERKMTTNRIVMAGTGFRTGIFNAIGYEGVESLTKREDVHVFIENVRSMVNQKAGGTNRAVSGANYLIPDVLLPAVRSETERYSKLLKHVNVSRVGGKSRQTIIGKAPESVWTEMDGVLNELDMKFTQIEIDGYKLGGFVPIDNSTLEDATDIDLLDEIVYQLGQGNAYALDKAIIYGKGSASHMPTGFAATATKETAGNVTDVNLFKKIVEFTGDLNHARGDLFWVCNSKTKAKILAASVGVNAAAAVVAGTNGTMPVIGGAIETLDFVADNELLGGYEMCYKLAERAGQRIAVSDQNRFVEDQTVFKVTTRYDGKPLFNDAFVAIGITSSAPTAALKSGYDFAADSANAAGGD